MASEQEVARDAVNFSAEFRRLYIVVQGNLGYQGHQEALVAKEALIGTFFKVILPKIWNV